MSGHNITRQVAASLCTLGWIRCYTVVDIFANNLLCRVISTNRYINTSCTYADTNTVSDIPAWCEPPSAIGSSCRFNFTCTSYRLAPMTITASSCSSGIWARHSSSIRCNKWLTYCNLISIGCCKSNMPITSWSGFTAFFIPLATGKPCNEIASACLNHTSSRTRREIAAKGCWGIRIQIN